MSEHVVLRYTRDSLGTRSLIARLTEDGELRIEGQDLGDGVEQVFGKGIREYEWDWTIPASQIPALRQALGASGNLLALLKERFSDDRADQLGKFLKEHDISFHVWNRLGD